MAALHHRRPAVAKLDLTRLGVLTKRSLCAAALAMVGYGVRG
ncbi:hypothetical protein ABZ208_29915 [Streptomyces sp. NPDC006208]